MSLYNGFKYNWIKCSVKDMTGLQIGLAVVVLPIEKIMSSVKKSMKCSFSCERNQCTTVPFRPLQAIPFIDGAGNTALSLVADACPYQSWLH